MFGKNGNRKRKCENVNSWERSFKEKTWNIRCKHSTPIGHKHCATTFLGFPNIFWRPPKFISRESLSYAGKVPNWKRRSKLLVRNFGAEFSWRIRPFQRLKKNPKKIAKTKDYPIGIWRVRRSVTERIMQLFEIFSAQVFIHSFTSHSKCT